MTYIPPLGNAVDYNFTSSGYLAPTGNSVNFNFAVSLVDTYITPDNANITILGYTPTVSYTFLFDFSPATGSLIMLGYSPSSAYLFPPIEIEWFGAEVLHSGAASINVEWNGVEVLHTGRADILLEWTGIEALHTGRASIEVEYFAVEVLMSIATKQTPFPKTMMII